MTPDAAPSRPPDPDTRSGYVALVGRPNAGKSTLMNALVGEKLSIVTSKAQTTWQRVTGILTTERSQLVFLDTPGLLDTRSLFQRSMLQAAVDALEEADVVLAVLDASRSAEEATDGPMAEALADVDVPLLAAVNKVDRAPADRVERLGRWVAEALGGRPFPVSALNGTGVEGLRTALEETLPPGPFLYPEDEIASQPVRFFVAELVRETVFEQYGQEIPWSVAARVEEFREAEDPLYVQVTLYVDRKSQKGILVGKGGRAIRETGKAARAKIEHFLGRHVYLDLWVKALPGWRRRRSHLARFGFRVPDEAS